MVTIAKDVLVAAVMTRYHYPEVWTPKMVVEHHRMLNVAQLHAIYGDDTVSAALADLEAHPRLYVDATEAGIRAFMSNKLGQESYGNHIFAPEEDRSPYYQQCDCYDRWTGGTLLHPSALAPGPCYEDENDLVGFEPE